MRHCSWWTLHAALLCSLACNDSDSPATSKDAGHADSGKPDTGAPDAGGKPAYRSAVYALDENWLCNPNSAKNRCKDGSPDATEVKADNKLTVLAAPQHVDSKLDCFYVYPTIDLSQTAGRVADYSNIETIWSTAKQQVGPFSDVCTVYAPLYHQAKIGSYLDPTRDDLLEAGYAEIEDAFKHYMGQYNKGRDIVLIGHSQGSHMLRRLIQRHFEGAENKTLLDQLAFALLVGPLGDITVPPGKLVGGTFKDVPLCSSASERGCLITYSTYPSNKPPTAAFGLFVGGVPAGMDTACSNPAALGGGKAAAGGAYFPSDQSGTTADAIPNLKKDLGVETYFAVYKGMYGFECKKNETGLSYLSVTVDQAAGDQRKDPIQYGTTAVSVDLVGLHLLDYHLAMADLQAVLTQHAK